MVILHGVNVLVVLLTRKRYYPDYVTDINSIPYWLSGNYYATNCLIFRHGPSKIFSEIVTTAIFVLYNILYG